MDSNVGVPQLSYSQACTQTLNFCGFQGGPHFIHSFYPVGGIQAQELEEKKILSRTSSHPWFMSYLKRKGKGINRTKPHMTIVCRKWNAHG